MRKLGRKKAHRENMLKNMATSIILYEKVTTTDAKAKEVRIYVEELINLGKEKSLSAYRKILRLVAHENAAKKISEDLASRFAKRNGGYLKMYKCGNRPGDNSKMTMLELIAAEKDTTKKEPSEKSTEKKEEKNIKNKTIVSVKKR